jgi:lysophospholipase L1-like esterase
MLQRIFIIMLAVIQSGCLKDRLPSPPGTPSPLPVIPVPTTVKKYLALGDSYTIGQGVAPAESFPVQTRNWLAANGITGIADPQIIAATGWTTANLQAAIATKNPSGPFAAVSLLIGVNDQYQGLDTAGYRTRFTQLLEKSISLANNLPAHVFVLSVPDYSVTPFAAYMDKEKITREIDEFNEINKQVSTIYNVQYLDITPLSRDLKNDPSLICFDGLHPSGLEYKLWAERLGAKIKAVLQ